MAAEEDLINEVQCNDRVHQHNGAGNFYGENGASTGERVHTYEPGNFLGSSSYANPQPSSLSLLPTSSAECLALKSSLKSSDKVAFIEADSLIWEFFPLLKSVLQTVLSKKMEELPLLDCFEKQDFSVYTMMKSTILQHLRTTQEIEKTGEDANLQKVLEDTLQNCQSLLQQLFSTCKPKVGVVPKVLFLRRIGYRIVFICSQPSWMSELVDLHKEWLGQDCTILPDAAILSNRSHNILSSAEDGFGDGSSLNEATKGSKSCLFLCKTKVLLDSLRQAVNSLDLMESLSLKIKIDESSKQQSVIQSLEEFAWDSLSTVDSPDEVCYEAKVKPMMKLRCASCEVSVWRHHIMLRKNFVRIDGKVVKGFGRGSAMLGIPTANVEKSSSYDSEDQLVPGVYFGWCKLNYREVSSEILKKQFGAVGNKVATDNFLDTTYGMVMSIGYNPYFDNSKLTIEPYLFHDFSGSFVGREISLNVMGMIRCESGFDRFEHLIRAIQNDCEVAVDILTELGASFPESMNWDFEASASSV